MQDKIIFARTFDFNVDNTSDHQPIIMKLNYHSNGVQLSANRDSVSNLKQKINWSKFNQAFIKAPLLSEIVLIDPVDLDHTDKLSEFITTIILKSSLSLVTPGTTGIKKRKHGIYDKLPVNVKESRSLCTSAFESWKQVDFVVRCTEHALCVAKRKDYGSALRAFLSQLEYDRVKKLCSAEEFDEKSFWKLIKGQRSSTQMSAFLVNGKLIITDKYDILDMWADHFEELGTPDLHTDYDNNFEARVSAFVANFSKTCLDHPVGVLSEPLSYEEVAKVCSSPKLGISGATLDYEHIRFAGPPFWHLLHELYCQFFLNFTVPKSLKTGLILPLFKGKGAKANNKDNY